MYAGWDGTIRNLDLAPEVAELAALGDKVRCRVIGDYEMGIAVIMRSRNPLDKRRYGFYVQPVNIDEHTPRGYEVWQAPAEKPEHGKLYWGIELLKREQAQPATPEVSMGLIRSLQQRAR